MPGFGGAIMKHAASNWVKVCNFFFLPFNELRLEN